MAKVTGLEGAIPSVGFAYGRWQKLYHNPVPSRQQLEVIACMVGFEADRLAEMLLPAGVK